MSRHEEAETVKRSLALQKRAGEEAEKDIEFSGGLNQLLPEHQLLVRNALIQFAKTGAARAWDLATQNGWVK